MGESRVIIAVPISGGSGDDPVSTVTAVLLDGPTCLECLAVKARLTLDGVAAAMQQITAAIELRSERRRCGGCDAETLVFSVEKPSPPRRHDRNRT